MRYSDQTNATTALMSNATIGGSGLIRRFAGNKISKVCTGHVMNFAIFPSKIRFLHDQSEPTNRFITGSWNSVGHGNLTLWTVRQGATVFGRDEGEEIERSSRIELGQTDVNDLWFVPWGRALLVIRWKVCFHVQRDQCPTICRRDGIRRSAHCWLSPWRNKWQQRWFGSNVHDGHLRACPQVSSEPKPHGIPIYLFREWENTALWDPPYPCAYNK